MMCHMQFTSWDNLHSTFTCCGTGIPLPFSKLHRNANGGIGRPRGIVDSMNVPLKGVELLASKQTCSQSFEWTNSNATLKFSGINQTQGMLGESCHILEEGQHSVYNTSLQLVATNRLRVQLSKEFSFDEEKNEFRWHKTWKLPEVRVIYMRPPGSCPESELTAWITCVCRTDLENSFEVLGLEGVTSQPLVDGQCTFSRLRFKSTSSLQRGKPFHLVVSVQKGDKCMDSLISKGIYVYSRKDADKKRKKMDHLTDSVSEITAADKAHAFYVAFSPDLFDRVFFRKVSDHQGRRIVEKIENSPKGLLLYFQAPNIRFKCRHPVFLLYRFSNALVLLRDSELFPSETVQVFRTFISDLETFCTESSKNDAASSSKSAAGRTWYICCRQGCKCNIEARRKIFENMELLQSDKLVFTADSSLCDPKFKAVSDMESLRLEYERLFALYSNSKMKPREDSADSMCTNVLPHDYSEDQSGQLDENELSLCIDNPIGDSECVVLSAEGRVFKERFEANHSEVRHVLSLLTDAAVNAVTDHSEASISHLRHAYNEFFRVLSVHMKVEDQIIFPILMNSIPGITESYHLDHFMEGQELSDIGDAIRNFDPINVGDLFLKITGFGASLKQHMFKEEEHILPRLLQALNDDELSGLRLQMDMELHQMCQRSKPFDSLQRRIPNRDSQEWEYCFESSRSKDSVSDFFD